MRGVVTFLFLLGLIAFVAIVFVLGLALVNHTVEPYQDPGLP